MLQSNQGRITNFPFDIGSQYPSRWHNWINFLCDASWECCKTPCYSVFSLFLEVKLDNSHTRESSKELLVHQQLLDRSCLAMLHRSTSSRLQLMICCTMTVCYYAWAALFTAYTVVLLCSSTDHELDLDLGCQVAILSRGCWPESIPWLFAKWKLSRLRAQRSPRSRTFGVWCGDAEPNGED